ncbi:MAG: phosphoribosylformimino-5-aminoimidazole carboxamide ribotide isomerase [Lachnospiraceae bacterium]|nr:phosphoribosylformimino-5-aminoimidazole carboxamide ribotide isomerase [Lachnospiraceae bacterium]
MEFRPCIDIHNGSVKQIVGSSLNDVRSTAVDNFVSGMDASYYAEMYKKDGFAGGHVIILNPEGSPYYEADMQQASKALSTFSGGMQAGGGINPGNAKKFLDMGASHVIATSYVFRDGVIDYARLKELSAVTGKERLVLDLSCRYTNDGYYIVTDRWQKTTKEKLGKGLLDKLGKYCDEFLVHAVDVEGKASGVEKEVINILAGCNSKVTYAGGIHLIEDITYIEEHGRGNVNFTIGSALDLFGGSIPYNSLKKYSANQWNR